MANKFTSQGWPDNVGKKGRLGLPGTKPKRFLHFQILDEIRAPQSDLPSKVIYLQKILFEDGRIELRLCYYILGKLPRMKDKWVFGQFATLLPAEDFKEIVSEAGDRGWI